MEAKQEHGPLVHAASKAVTTPHVTRALVASEPAFGTPPSRTGPGSGCALPAPLQQSQCLFWAGPLCRKASIRHTTPAQATVLHLLVVVRIQAAVSRSLNLLVSRRVPGMVLHSDLKVLGQRNVAAACLWAGGCGSADRLLLVWWMALESRIQSLPCL